MNQDSLAKVYESSKLSEARAVLDGALGVLDLLIHLGLEIGRRSVPDSGADKPRWQRNLQCSCYMPFLSFADLYGIRVRLSGVLLSFLPSCLQAFPAFLPSFLHA